MRFWALCALLVLLTGCASTAASKPNPSPTAQLKWSHPPAMAINPHHRYWATIKTSDGSFTITLLAASAPITVNNFVFLARHRYFDGNIFHRIIKTFMVQTGDPTGTGYGGPGYQFKNEFVNRKFTPGVVAMANAGPNTNGSQFFIVTGPDASVLKPQSYTIFGVVTQGMSIVQKIASTPVIVNPATNVAEEPAPGHETTIGSVTIHEAA